MKKINNIVLLTAALAASLACQKAEINEQKPQSEGRFTVLVTTEEISTRTVFGTLSGDNKYPTLWQAGNEVKFSLNNAEGVSAAAEVVGGVQLLSSLLRLQMYRPSPTPSMLFLLQVQLLPLPRTAFL